MRDIKVNILRGAETGSGKFQTFTVSVDDEAIVSVMNLLEEI